MVLWLAYLPPVILLARESTSAHIHLLRLPGGRDIEIEDIHGQAERGTCIGNLLGTKLNSGSLSALIPRLAPNPPTQRQEGLEENKKLTSTIPAMCPCTGAQLNSK